MRRGIARQRSRNHNSTYVEISVAAMPALNRPRGPRARRVAPPAILDAAQQVFSVAGVEGATIRAIARKVGCDPSLIYYHYDSKEALFLALMERRLPPLAARLQEVALPQEPWNSHERIWAALEAFKLHLGDDAGFRSLFRGQFVQGSEAMKDAVAAHLRPIIGAMKAILQRGIDRGDLRPDLDPTTTAFFIGRMHMEILDLIPSLGSRLADLPVPETLERMRRSWLEFLWRAIALNPESGKGAP